MPDGQSNPLSIVHDWLPAYPADHPLSRRLRRALIHQLKRFPQPLDHMAVAVSGGPDSAMLAVELAVLARQTNSAPPHVFHVHHGLQQAADGWEEHVQELAAGLSLPCHSIRVEVGASAAIGVEAAARAARYRAYRQLANHCGVGVVLLAHHQDDQAETVMLRLLRGSGPTGLAAMRPVSRRDGLLFVRPWLDIPRAAILQQMQRFLMATGWAPIHDPTNYQDHYTRSALRERLAPQLDQRWPGWQGILARHAELAGETAEILDEVAEKDFSRLQPGPDGRDFSLLAWRKLSPARQAHVLRFWLASQGLRAPSHARLTDIMRQLRGLHALGHDRSMQVRHAGAIIMCQRGRVLLKHGKTS